MFSGRCRCSRVSRHDTRRHAAGLVGLACAGSPFQKLPHPAPRLAPLSPLWTRSGIWYYVWLLEPKSIQNPCCKGVGDAHWLASAAGRGASQDGGGGTMTYSAREPAPRECRARLGPGASLRHTCSLSAWKVSELGTEPRSDSELCILSILTCFSPAGQALPPPTSHTGAGLSVVPDGAGRLEGPSEPGELAVSMFSKSESLLALSGRS